MLDHEDQSREIEGQSSVPYAFVQQKSEYLGPDGVPSWQPGFVNGMLDHEDQSRELEGQSSVPYAFAQKTDKNKAKCNAKSKDVLGDDCVSDWQHGFVNDKISPDKEDTYITAQKKSKYVGPDGIPAW
jgi:hypothetical protein